jgi:hypothetical protein
MIETKTERDGASLNLGTHWIGRFAEACVECGEVASHRFAGSTFGVEYFLCGKHAAIALLADAGEADEDAVTEYLVAQGWGRPQGLTG